MPYCTCMDSGVAVDMNTYIITVDVNTVSLIAYSKII